MFRVIATYPGFSPELEEELYFATRRRPDQAGQMPVAPQVESHEPDVEGGIHHPKEIHQLHRFLSYNAGSEFEARSLANRIEGAPGVTVQIVDDRKPEPTVEAAPEQIAEEPAQMGVAALQDGPAVHIPKPHGAPAEVVEAQPEVQAIEEQPHADAD